MQYYFHIGRNSQLNKTLTSHPVANTARGAIVAHFRLSPVSVEYAQEKFDLFQAASRWTACITF